LQARAVPLALYDRGVTATDESPIARDAKSAAAAWRPQRFSETGGDVADPVIEPLWTGLRVLAHVEDGAATMRDLDGDAVADFPDVAAELVTANLTERFIVDGYLTHQVLQEPAAVAKRAAAEKSMASPTMNQMWFGNLLRRRRPVAPAVEQVERIAPAVTEDVALVIVDILWLDDQPLLDVPLLERKRVMESVVRESRLVRLGTFVRPPVDPWLGSWRTFGFSRMSYKAANSRYLPGRQNPQWTVADVPAR
jgi:ATP-dependent DNA ligase